MRFNTLPTAILGLILAAGPAAAEFRLSFDWGDIPRCTSGRPNTVGNPAFVLRDLPKGTDRVSFRLKDLDVPGYNHGGGAVKMSASGTVPAGIFTYRSPCPPSGTHTYEWTATATRKGKTLAVAKARRTYP